MLERVGFLIAIALVGIIVGKKFKTNQQDISTLLVYVITPAVMFVSVLQAPSGDYLRFSVGAFLACSTSAILAYNAARLLWRDNVKNLFAFAGGTGNTGYFGLPMALALFDAHGAAVAVFIIFGANVYDFTVGYFITSRGAHSVRDSLKTVIRMPTLYAFALASLVKGTALMPSEVLIASMNNFKGAYSILGMMVIGLTLSKIERFEVDFKFLVAAIGWKYVVWPCFGLLLVTLFRPSLAPVEQAAMMLMACVPMAGNTVVVANQLRLHPEKAATAVMASTLLAMASMPGLMYLIRSWQA
ncbi:MAG: AEC family transporter [Gammaproteobacteria bacterium]